VEHVSADNMEPVRSYIADWIEGLCEPTGVRSRFLPWP